MVDLDWRVERRAEISLVELTVANPTETPRRVRVGNRLDGAVWPPRREGVPEAGWDDGGFEGVVAPGGRRALGYATPAPPAEPPVEVVWTERAGSSERDGTSADGGPELPSDRPAVDATPEGVVRALGDARPPADAVPRPALGDAHFAVPEPVESWLSAVEQRVDEAGGLTVDDRRALDAVARRTVALRGRAEGSEPGGSA